MHGLDSPRLFRTELTIPAVSLHERGEQWPDLSISRVSVKDVRVRRGGKLRWILFARKKTGCRGGKRSNEFEFMAAARENLWAGNWQAEIEIKSDEERVRWIFLSGPTFGLIFLNTEAGSHRMKSSLPGRLIDNGKSCPLSSDVNTNSIFQVRGTDVYRMRIFIWKSNNLFW